MSTKQYDVGDVARIAFALGSTATTDPSAGTDVRLVYTDPAGADTVKTLGQLTKASAGQLSTFSTLAGQPGWGVSAWYYDVPLTKAGRWTWYFRSSGTVAGAASGAIAAAGPLASTST